MHLTTKVTFMCVCLCEIPHGGKLAALQIWIADQIVLNILTDLFGSNATAPLHLRK